MDLGLVVWPFICKTQLTRLQKITLAPFSKADKTSPLADSLPAGPIPLFVARRSSGFTSRMRCGVRKPLCFPLGLQCAGAGWPDCLHPWCWGSCLAHLAHVKRGETALVLPTLFPFTQLLIAVHKEMLPNTFHHLYLLAGELKGFIGPGTDIQTSKEILFVIGGGGPHLGLGKCMQHVSCRSCTSPPGT